MEGKSKTGLMYSITLLVIIIIIEIIINNKLL